MQVQEGSAVSRFCEGKNRLQKNMGRTCLFNGGQVFVLPVVQNYLPSRALRNKFFTEAGKASLPKGNFCTWKLWHLTIPSLLIYLMGRAHQMCI